MTDMARQENPPAQGSTWRQTPPRMSASDPARRGGIALFGSCFTLQHVRVPIGLVICPALNLKPANNRRQLSNTHHRIHEY
jgi:hypothetical protein